MQLVEANDLVDLHVDASLGHEAQASLRTRRLELVQVEDVGLLREDLVVQDAGITLKSGRKRKEKC